MSRSIISRELVAQQLAISTKVLIRYERLGLVRVCQEGDVQGYEPAQVRRLWTIASFQRDLGINLAGVEVILRLHDQMLELRHRLDGLAGHLRELVEQDEAQQASPLPTDSHD
ncbi:MAG: chaperone modulator CbpM [Isosphaeraceae bacterium]